MSDSRTMWQRLIDAILHRGPGYDLAPPTAEATQPRNREAVDRLNEIAERWEHGHAELTADCALCEGEWAEVHAVLHGPQAGAL